MKWFNTQTEADRSHERIMAILDEIDPAELFGPFTPPEPALAGKSSPQVETRES